MFVAPVCHPAHATRNATRQKIRFGKRPTFGSATASLAYRSSVKVKTLVASFAFFNVPSVLGGACMVAGTIVLTPGWCKAFVILQLLESTNSTF